MKQFRWQAWQRWWLLYCLVCLQGSAGIYFKIIYPHVFFVHIQPHDNFTQNAENEKSQLLNTFFTNYKKKKIDKLFIKQKRWCGIFSSGYYIDKNCFFLFLLLTHFFICCCCCCCCCCDGQMFCWGQNIQSVCLYPPNLILHGSHELLPFDIHPQTLSLSLSFLQDNF